MNLIAGILCQEVERPGFAAAGFNPRDRSASNRLTGPNIAGPDSVHAVHTTKVNGCAAIKGDTQEYRLRALHIGMLL